MKILLALDTSAASQSALEEVAARPWAADAAFEVISVVHPSHLWTTQEVAEDAARAAQEVVNGAVARLQSSGRMVTGLTLPGDPKAVILDRARSTAAGLIVVGSHGASDITRILMGSVAMAVLRYAPCSVAVVRARAQNDPAGSRKVLLATDGSESSERAARSIAGRPWPAGTEVRVLSVVELVLPTARVFLEPPYFDSAFVESARADAMKRAQDAIAESMQILTGAGLNASESVSVLLDSPHVIILHEAEEWGAGLIVLGSHGHHGVDRFLLGSVSEGVAMHAACSVEVIRC